jgi:arylsulfatase A-like enzyme
MPSRRTFLQTLAAAGLQAAGARPNILLILADDLGYSDLGCFGGEIATPNLDRLARGGVRFTQFYNSARCCPSRAALMTGLYPHQAGMGNMTSPKGGDPRFPGYVGRIPETTPFLPRILNDAGYSTLMAGKWHLEQPGPVQRGFDEFYGMVHGFDSFWDSSRYTRLPADRRSRAYTEGSFYATDAITDHAIDFVQSARGTPKPWFLYLAYNAPHFPLHAPKALIDKYVPVYEQGWDVIRKRREQRLRELGLMEKHWQLPERGVVGPNRVSNVNGWAARQNPAWDSLEPERRADLARRMATFAAMVEVMDRNIGRVLADLEKNNELENTLILFASDNGACAEWDPFGFDIRSGPDNVLHKGADLDKMGQPGTYHSYGSAWANAGNTPWRLYKHYTHEGGIASPCIAHWPRGIRRPGAIDKSVIAHFIDVVPTLAAAAGKAMRGTEGVNLLPALEGKSVQRGPLFWEHEGSRAVRDGRWKLTAVGPAGAWELYDMQADRTELNNLAAAHPGRVREMAAHWERWATRANVIPWIWSPQYRGAE